MREARDVLCWCLAVSQHNKRWRVGRHLLIARRLVRTIAVMTVLLTLTAALVLHLVSGVPSGSESRSRSLPPNVASGNHQNVTLNESRSIANWTYEISQEPWYTDYDETPPEVNAISIEPSIQDTYTHKLQRQLRTSDLLPKNLDPSQINQSSVGILETQLFLQVDDSVTVYHGFNEVEEDYYASIITSKPTSELFTSFSITEENIQVQFSDLSNGSVLNYSNFNSSLFTMTEPDTTTSDVILSRITPTNTSSSIEHTRLVQDDPYREPSQNITLLSEQNSYQQNFMAKNQYLNESERDVHSLISYSSKALQEMNATTVVSQLPSNNLENKIDSSILFNSDFDSTNDEIGHNNTFTSLNTSKEIKIESYPNILINESSEINVSNTVLLSPSQFNENSTNHISIMETEATFTQTVLSTLSICSSCIEPSDKILEMEMTEPTEILHVTFSVPNEILTIKHSNSALQNMQQSNLLSTMTLSRNISSMPESIDFTKPYEHEIDSEEAFIPSTPTFANNAAKATTILTNIFIINESMISTATENLNDRETKSFNTSLIHDFPISSKDQEVDKLNNNLNVSLDASNENITVVTTYDLPAVSTTSCTLGNNQDITQIFSESFILSSKNLDIQALNITDLLNLSITSSTNFYQTSSWLTNYTSDIKSTLETQGIAGTLYLYTTSSNLENSKNVFDGDNTFPSTCNFCKPNQICVRSSVGNIFSCEDTSSLYLLNTTTYSNLSSVRVSAFEPITTRDLMVPSSLTTILRPHDGTVTATRTARPRNRTVSIHTTTARPRHRTTANQMATITRMLKRTALTRDTTTTRSRGRTEPTTLTPQIKVLQSHSCKNLSLTNIYNHSASIFIKYAGSNSSWFRRYDWNFRSALSLILKQENCQAMKFQKSYTVEDIIYITPSPLKYNSNLLIMLIAKARENNSKNSYLIPARLITKCIRQNQNITEKQINLTISAIFAEPPFEYAAFCQGMKIKMNKDRSISYFLLSCLCSMILFLLALTYCMWRFRDFLCPVVGHNNLQGRMLDSAEFLNQQQNQLTLDNDSTLHINVQQQRTDHGSDDDYYLQDKSSLCMVLETNDEPIPLQPLRGSYNEAAVDCGPVNATSTSELQYIPAVFAVAALANNLSGTSKHHDIALQLANTK